MPRGWVINGYDGFDGLELIELPEETPGHGEVRLRIEAFALNWGDIDLMSDMYSFSFEEFPARIGIEACGVIDAVGPGVKGFEIGHRVCTLPYFYYQRGASAESTIIDECYITPAPAGLTAVEGASIWMQYLTAYFPLVEESKAGPDSHILVTAGTSTAGTAALMIGRRMGANLIATTRSADSRDYLTDVGANHVFIDGGGDLAAFIREATAGHGVDAVFDAVGASMISRYAQALAKDSQVHWYGFLDGQLPQIPIIDLVVANAVLHPYSLFNYVERPDRIERGKAFVYEALADGGIAPRIDRVYPMEGYRDACAYMRGPRSAHGKIVIETGL